MKCVPLKALMFLSLMSTLASLLACNIERTSSQPLPERFETQVTPVHGSSFAISTRGAASAVLVTGTFAPPMAPALSIAMADFTGDTHPDLATVELERFDFSSAQYWIEIRLTEGGRQLLKVTAPFGGLVITPRDLTGDGNLDLVVRSAKSHDPVAIFLNDGRGHFSRSDIGVFRNALRGGPSPFGFNTPQMYVGAASACLESSMAECSTGQPGILREHEGSLLRSTFRAAARLFHSFEATRAPPSLA